MNALSSELPSHLPCDPFDFVILYHASDKSIARTLCEKIKNINLKHRLNIKCCLYNDVDIPTGLEFKSVEKITDIAVQTWFIISENSIHDDVLNHHKDEAIMISLKTKRNCFVPVFTKPKEEFDNLPYALMAYKGINLGSASFDRNVERLFNDKSHMIQMEYLRTVQNQRQ